MADRRWPTAAFQREDPTRTHMTIEELYQNMLAPNPAAARKRAALRAVACCILVALSACASPTTGSLRLTLAERGAFHATVERCVRNSADGEAAREGCVMLWRMTQVFGAYWAAKRLEADESLSKNRPAFEEQLARQIGGERQICLARWLVREQQNGPPQLDSPPVNLGRSFCLASAKLFEGGANALFDEASR